MRPDEPLPIGEIVPPAGAHRVPRREPLSGRVVSLIPLDPERDRARLYAVSHGTPEKERLWTYMGYGPFADEAAMGVWLASCAESDDPLFFTVMDRRSGSPIGMVSLLEIEPAMRRVEIGHVWYTPGAERKRANTEAVYLLLRAAFEHLRYRRVEWKCHALNAPSRAAAQRLGFEFEGVFRQHMIAKGRNRDTAWYAMLDGDWPAAREALEGVLAGDA